LFFRREQALHGRFEFRGRLFCPPRVLSPARVNSVCVRFCRIVRQIIEPKRRLVAIDVDESHDAVTDADGIADGKLNLLKLHAAPPADRSAHATISLVRPGLYQVDRRR